MLTGGDMSKIEGFLKEVGEGIVGIASEYVKGAKKRGIDDMKAYALERAKDVERWGGQLARGELSAADFEFLIKGMKDAAEIHGLMIAGVELARLQRARDALVDLVINTAIGTFLPGARTG